MSLWRREASKFLPEFQSFIANPDLEGPWDLWLDLASKFDDLSRERPVQADLLSRIWKYAQWSLEHPDEKIRFAVTAHFLSDLKDTRNNREVFPPIIGADQYNQYFSSDTDR